MSKKYLYNPLTSVAVIGKIFREYGAFTAVQVYNNVSDFEMESAYYFRLPENAVMREFKLVITDNDGVKSMLFSKVIEHHEAQRLYDVAGEFGDLGVILQTLANNTYKITVGRQLIAARTEIHITYYCQFESGLTSKLKFPLAITENDVPNGVECTFADEVDYHIELDLEVIANADVARISSKSHDISINESDGFTTLNFADKIAAPVGELEIDIEYAESAEYLPPRYRIKDGKFMQEVPEFGGFVRSPILEFLHYGNKIREMETSLHKLPSCEQAQTKMEILQTALKHNILCSQTSFYAEVANETRAVAAVHKFAVPIQRKDFNFEFGEEITIVDSKKLSEYIENTALFEKCAAIISSSQRANGIVADIYEYNEENCAKITALSLVALASFAKKYEKYENQLFDEDFLNKSLDYLIKYLAEDGNFSYEIKHCFRFAIDNFLVSGERAKILRKILENVEKIDNTDILSNFTILKNQPVYEVRYAIKMLLDYLKNNIKV